MGVSDRDKTRHGDGQAASSAEGARRATGADDAERDAGGPLGPGRRWTTSRKREVVLRLFRGESLDKLSRELGVEIYRLEKWRDRALAGIDAGLKTRPTDPLQAELDAAIKRVGELTMDNELLVERCRRSNIPFPKGRSKK
jgi:transposase